MKMSFGAMLLLFLLLTSNGFSAEFNKVKPTGFSAHGIELGAPIPANFEFIHRNKNGGRNIIQDSERNSYDVWLDSGQRVVKLRIIHAEVTNAEVGSAIIVQKNQALLYLEKISQRIIKRTNWLYLPDFNVCVEFDAIVLKKSCVPYTMWYVFPPQKQNDEKGKKQLDCTPKDWSP